MSLIDLILSSFVIVAGFTDSPYVAILVGGFAAYLGKLAVEKIPYTRRIIERREAATRGQ